MDITIPSFLLENSMTYGIVLAFSLLGVSLKVVSGVIDFYEEVLIKRYFKRFSTLNENVSDSIPVNNYLAKLKDNEAFRLASGIKTYPDKSNMLMEIYLLGCADNRELKRIHRYLQPVEDNINLDVSWGDKAQFIWAYISASYLLVTGLVLGGPFFIAGKGSKSLAGLAILIIFTITASIVGTDCRTYNTLKRVHRSLINKNKILNPEKKIILSRP